ncbi:MAG: carbonic anhydrase family protein [Betaproteobacteria bacterium]|nr:carbonic anhydrase family protein [Betaproteobacteria bacterium]
MRSFILLVLAVSPLALAAPTWQNVSSEPGKRIEIDRTSIKREGATVETTSRMVLDKELVDVRSGDPYLVIEVITRYDCMARNASTLKRSFKKGDNSIVREETLKADNLPVRTGTLDDKVLREVCRPPRGSPGELAAQADEAAKSLRQANEALVKKELAKPVPVKTAARRDVASAAPIEPPGAIPLKAAPARKAPAPAAKGKPAADKEAGYMLELVQPLKPASAVDWGYDGASAPENWATLDSRYGLCASGQRQSPIDIRDGIKVDVEPIHFDYRPSRFRIIDSGRSLEVFLGDNAITLTGKTYALQEIRFSHPSEERVDGRRFDMSVHLMHRADDGQLAVIAVLLERGPENPFIQTLWNYLPLEKRLAVEPPDVTVNLDALLPAARSYYTYMGSLTTPPCTEGVLWLVLKQPAPVSAEQIDIFSRLYRDNARPVQATAGRIIKESR